MSTPRMPARRGLLPLAAVADRERRDGGPERVIRRKHPVIPVPVLARRWHEIGEPVEKLKRREIDDAPGRVDFRPRPRPTQVAALCQPSMSAAAAASRSCVRLNQRIRRHEDAVGDAGMEMHVTVEGRAEAVQEGDQILIGRHSGYHGSSLLDHPFRPPEVHRYQSMGR